MTALEDGVYNMEEAVAPTPSRPRLAPAQEARSTGAIFDIHTIRGVGYLLAERTA